MSRRNGSIAFAELRVHGVWHTQSPLDILRAQRDSREAERHFCGVRFLRPGLPMWPYVAIL
jgi:hypothetical protein